MEGVSIIDTYFKICLKMCFIACENIRFSSLFAAGDVSRRGTSATQDRNSILMTQINVYIINPVVMRFFCSILVKCCVHLPTCSMQQNANAPSREDYIPQILAVLFEILRVYL